jgi:hypothetical protein
MSDHLKITVDQVSHPEHYTSDPSGVECLEITRHRNFNIGNAIKYLWRAGLKNEEKHVEDLKKAIFYIQDEIYRIEEYLKGSDPTKISKDLSMPRVRVVALINEWKVMASANDAIRGRAKEALAAADQHYGKLISKAYEVIDEAGLNNNLGAKTNAIKLVLDIESKRIDMLQKAGLLENKELAEEILEVEQKQEVLIGILRDIASEYPQVRDEIMKRLSSIAKDNEVITIVHDVQ